MSKQASPATIGAFVVGAVVLVVVGVMIFGTGKFLAEKVPFVLYFPGSIKGLNVGAPVSFRGVKVGEVADIRVDVDHRDGTVRTPVFVEIEPDRVHHIGEPSAEVPGILERLKRLGEPGKQRYIHFSRMVQQGLRAQLQMQSLVTGQLFVQLDFHPDTEIKLSGLPGPYPELPTIRSGMAAFAKKLEEMPLQDLVEAGARAAQGIDQLVRSPELAQAIANLNKSMENISGLTAQLDARFASFDKHVKDTLRSAQSTLRQAETTLKMEKGVPGELADSLNATLAQAEKTLAMEEGAPGRLVSSLKATSDAARRTLVKSQATLATVQDAIDQESPIRYELVRTLQELSAAARSIRVLTDYLERHPEAIITGKGGRGGRG